MTDRLKRGREGERDERSRKGMRQGLQEVGREGVGA